MPAPPPNGVSSTERWASWRGVPEVVGAQVEETPAPGPTEDGVAGVVVDDLGEDGEDVDPHSRSPSGDVDGHDAARRRRRRTNRARDQAATVEHQQVAGRVGLDGRDRRRARRPSTSTHRRPMSSWTHRASATSSGLGAQHGAAQRLGGVERVDPLEGDDEAVLSARERDDASVAVARRRAATPGSTRSDLVRRRADDDLAAQPVGPDDPADLEQRRPRGRHLSRRCRRWC